MSNTPQPPVIGQEDWGDDLNAYLASLEAKVLPAAGIAESILCKNSDDDFDAHWEALDELVTAGPQGPQGEQGIQGPPGPVGATGPQGTEGPEGPPGTEGPVGAQGPGGAIGPQGPQGEAGVSVGAAAFNWSNNNNASDPGVGGVKCNTTLPSLSTEWYVSRYDRTGAFVHFTHLAEGITYVIYESKKVNTWDRYLVTGDSIDMGEWMRVPVQFVDSGPQAFNPGGNDIVQVESEAGQKAGPVGPQGPQGEQGPTGPSGATGSGGPPGVQGPIGLTGSQGPPGLVGPQGSMGVQGVQGPAGVKGDKGDTGSQGVQGIPGPQGASGPQGTPGPAGPVGPGSTNAVWNWLAAATTGTVAASRLAVDNDQPSQATKMIMHKQNTSGGIDWGWIIQRAMIGNTIFLQMKTDFTSWHRYRVTGLAVLNGGTTWEIPVTTVSGSAPGTEPSNGSDVLVVFEF